jgi:hypothetical protein
MPINAQTDTNLLAGVRDFGDTARKSYQAAIADMDYIRKGQESTTVNKLLGESFNPETGTFDKNRLLGGLAQSGLGNQIPQQLENLQTNELNTLKLAGEKVNTSLKQLGLIGQLFGNITTKAEYDAAKAKAQELGVDVSKYPDAVDDAAATSFSKTATNNAVSATDKLELDYKNSELFTRMEKYRLAGEAAQTKAVQDANQSTITSNETARHNRAIEINQQQQLEIQANKPIPLPEGEKITQREEAKYNVELDKELGKNKQLKDTLGETIDINGKPINKLEHLIDSSLGSAPEAYLKNTLGSTIGVSTDAASATKQLEMAGARILAAIPYPPGAQSEKELEARQKQVGDISNPNIPIETRKALLKNLKDYADNFEQTHPKKLDSSTSGSTQPTKSLSAMQAKYPQGITPEEKQQLDAIYVEKGYK